MTSPSLGQQHPPLSAFGDFLDQYPLYRRTETLDHLRAREFHRLDTAAQTYLDYTGACPYPACLIDHHRDLLQMTVLGNPHSNHQAAAAAARLQQQARSDILRYFNADPAEYLVIFTANASGALRLVGESYPFHPQGEFLLTADNHNSVNGIREFAHRHGAAVRYIPSRPATLEVGELHPYLAETPSRGNSLLAFPAQSNFSGIQHPLAWIDHAHAKGYDVLLDAAAFVPTNRLDLTRTRPDFVALSFYKMFGYPTGIGALLARRGAAKKLIRPTFSGGTVKIVSTQVRAHLMHDDEAAFEDGTVNYLAFPAVSAGLAFLDATGIDTVHRRVSILASHLIDSLRYLRHAGGQAAIEVYGTGNNAKRGGTIAFNVRDAGGVLVDCEAVERRAAKEGIALRSGCFCNPGAAEAALGHTPALMTECLAQGGPVTDLAMRYRAYLHSTGKAAGAVRASLGMGSNFTDVCRLIDFLSGLLDRPAAELSLAE